MTAPRVLIVVDRAVLGGAERLLIDVATGLHQEGVRIQVATAEPGPLVACLDAAAIPVLAPDVALRARDLLAPVTASDVVIGWADHAHLLVGPVAAQIGRPAVWWRTRTWRDRPYEWDASEVPAAAIVCPTAAGASGLEKALVSDLDDVVERTCVISPGIGVAGVAARRSEGERVRRELGWSRALVVGMVARLDPHKGQDDLIHAARAVCDADDDVRVLIVGSDIVGFDLDVEGDLARLVDKFDLGERVRFVPQVADPIPYQAALDIAVNASSHEAFGLSMLESLALGVAVIATDTDGARELIEPGVSGDLVPIGDIDALTVAIAGLSRDGDRRRRMAEAARLRAEAFDISSTIDTTAGLVARLAEGALLP